ncbi:MAG: hypothetical protein ACYSUC_11430 [Planctomycetota bacterium]|jgi:hypothetical protein
MMDDSKIDALIEEQMEDMEKLTDVGFQYHTRIQATQALALLGIWDELRRKKLDSAKSL